MTESSPSYPDSRELRRGPGSVCTSAVTLLCLVVLSAWLGRASAQQPPQAADQVPTTPGGSTPDAQAKERPKSPRLPPSSLIDEAKAKLASWNPARPSSASGSRCSTSSLTLKGRYRKAPHYRALLPAHVSGLPETTGTTPPGLRWRDAMGLPGHPRVSRSTTSSASSR